MSDLIDKTTQPSPRLRCRFHAASNLARCRRQFPMSYNAAPTLPDLDLQQGEQHRGERRHMEVAAGRSEAGLRSDAVATD